MNHFFHEENIPVICKGFQVYNTTKEILRPSKEVQPYYSPSITNQLALQIPIDKVTDHIRNNRNKNKAKIDVVASRSNGIHIYQIMELEIRFEGIYKVDGDSIEFADDFSFASIGREVIQPLGNLFSFVDVNLQM